MLIVNADDLGRSPAETDTALACYRQGRITSATAMVYMKDSCRSVDLARSCGIDLGLHLTLSESFSASQVPQSLRDRHDAVVRFLRRHKYAQLLYNPPLAKHFPYVFEAQMDEFCRLYGRGPSHIDGHHHKHLCSNILLGRVLPAGEKVRRSFSYWTGRSLWKRAYRHIVDRHLERRYRVTDYFFGLGECLAHQRLGRVFELARSFDVELMTHPISQVEYAYLMSEPHLCSLRDVAFSTYGALQR